MKFRELILILIFAAAITYVTRPLLVPAEPKGKFAQRHPAAAKILNKGATLAKWAGIYFLFADDLATPDKSGEYDPNHSPPYSPGEEKLYGDGDYQHYAANQSPARDVGKDGFPIISHGKGW